MNSLASFFNTHSNQITSVSHRLIAAGNFSVNLQSNSSDYWIILLKCCTVVAGQQVETEVLCGCSCWLVNTVDPSMQELQWTVSCRESWSRVRSTTSTQERNTLKTPSTSRCPTATSRPTCRRDTWVKSERRITFLSSHTNSSPPVDADGGGPRLPGEGPAAGGSVRQRPLPDGEGDGGGLHHSGSPPLHWQRAPRHRPDLRHHTALLQPTASWVSRGRNWSRTCPI